MNVPSTLGATHDVRVEPMHPRKLRRWLRQYVAESNAAQVPPEHAVVAALARHDDLAAHQAAAPRAVADVVASASTKVARGEISIDDAATELAAVRSQHAAGDDLAALLDAAKATALADGWHHLVGLGETITTDVFGPAAADVVDRVAALEPLLPPSATGLDQAAALGKRNAAAWVDLHDLTERWVALAKLATTLRVAGVTPPTERRVVRPHLHLFERPDLAADIAERAQRSRREDRLLLDLALGEAGPGIYTVAHLAGTEPIAV